MIIFFLLSSINIIVLYNLASWQRGKEESGEEGEKQEERRRKKRSQRRRAAPRSRTAEPTKCQEITSESDTVAATNQIPIPLGMYSRRDKQQPEGIWGP